jgi:hypothetical protein
MHSFEFYCANFDAKFSFCGFRMLNPAQRPALEIIDHICRRPLLRIYLLDLGVFPLKLYCLASGCDTIRLHDYLLRLRGIAQFSTSVIACGC